MEKLCKIIQDFGLVERPYTNKQGENKVFKSRTLKLYDGIDCFVADLVQEKAEAYQPLDMDTYHAVQCQIGVREWADKDGVAHYSNEIIIRSIV